MNKQLYLNMFLSKWIWYFGMSVIFINLFTTIFISDYKEVLMPFIDLLNIIAVLYTTSSYLSIHHMMKQDGNHHFYFSLPNTKRNIITGDYLYYILMMALTTAIFGSYMTLTQTTYYAYGFVMLMGISLIMMSFYYLGFAKYWLRYLFTGYFIYGVPMVLTWLFHFMPLVNISQMDKNMPGMNFYLYHLPVYTIVFAIMLLILSYVINLQNIRKYDMA
ncbi:hypothetical protein [Salinicoccus jeotgali]|uniref:ABC transporter permease n=1 Tax=Salinicoccus jeotgali TaxID=381634 RepID=A0ABP7ESP1_9STAP